MLHRPTYCQEKCWRSPVLPPRIFLPKRSKNCHSNLAQETWGFSSGGATSLLLLKPHHNTLYCAPMTDQYNSPKIYCLFYTVAWQVLIRRELNLTVSLLNSLQNLCPLGNCLFNSLKKYFASIGIQYRSILGWIRPAKILLYHKEKLHNAINFKDRKSN